MEVVMDWMSVRVDLICDLRFLVDFVSSLESALVVVLEVVLAPMMTASGIIICPISTSISSISSCTDRSVNLFHSQLC